MMQNSWLTLPLQAPYILPTDADTIKAFNQKANPDHQLQTEYFPEPYLGNVNQAKVFLLNLNPGVDVTNKNTHKKSSYLNSSWKNLKQKKQAYPFFLLDPALENIPGNKWWIKKLKRLIIDTSLKRVANGIACIEIHGYPSKKYRHFPNLPSMQYSKHLVEMGMQKKSFFIVMRGQAYWQNLVPLLSSYPQKTHVLSVQNPCITPKNLCNSLDYDKIINLI